ncbi:putative hydrolase [Gordonia effusa NBRC 100432]|uniref:Putative hydrolase n=1 Tax=Gordonia effusa NBRC 100432 TaxID=1077974 RepID=H0R574_9ACTN|nr:amidohydrolase family protein [Gordonia effusa]GAB20225.1 putative hydrolase [Gordonia effusa NBRC 100432]
MSTPYALTHTTVVTGDATGTVLPDQTIVVGPDGAISAIGPAATTDVLAGHRTIDATGTFTAPGLINAHAHLFSDGKPLPAILTSEHSETAVAAFFHSPIGRMFVKRRATKNVLTQLRSGVTTIRSLGDAGYEVVAVRNEIGAGKYPGPRILASGPLLAVSGGHGTPTIALVSDNPWDARKNVRVNLRNGVDAIKIAATGGVTDARAIGEAGRPQMTEEEMTAICEEAHKAGIVVAAHAESLDGVRSALRAGVDTIEHGSEMDNEIIDLFHDNPRSLHGRSALIPTLMAALPLVKLSESETGADRIVRANAEIVLDRIIAAIHGAHENGIAMGMGTDSALTYVTHYNTWRELDYVVRYGGLSHAEAFHAATGANAAILGIDGETGSLAVGKSADLVVLDADPLADFRAFVGPRFVAIRGHLLERPDVERFDDLDAKLDSF